MAASKDPDDPRGLIRESYAIEGISDSECRSIFFDWALGPDLPADADQRAAIRRLLGTYGTDAPDHPMTRVLTEGLESGAATPRRRGGRAARPGTDEAG